MQGAATRGARLGTGLGLISRQGVEAGDGNGGSGGGGGGGGPPSLFLYGCGIAKSHLGQFATIAKSLPRTPPANNKK